MFEVNGRMIRVSRGDTGLITFEVEGIELTENDRAVFTVKRRSGGTVLEKVLQPEGGACLIPFTNGETEKIPVGDYVWDIRIVLDAQMDGEGRVTDGREVITPMHPGVFRIVKVVGSV